MRKAIGLIIYGMGLAHLAVAALEGQPYYITISAIAVGLGASIFTGGE